jgi:thioredoxin-related protein
MKILASLLLAIALLSSTGCAEQARDLGYDPGADPQAALASARTLASASNKSVLIIAGGDWCRWCHVLDRFIHDNSEVEAALDKAFVTVKVYADGEGGNNEAFFAGLPEAPGYPHFWVVDRNGNVRSYFTGDLERGEDDYDPEKFLRFIEAASGRH